MNLHVNEWMNCLCHVRYELWTKVRLEWKEKKLILISKKISLSIGYMAQGRNSIQRIRKLLQKIFKNLIIELPWNFQ